MTPAFLAPLYFDVDKRDPEGEMFRDVGEVSPPSKSAGKEATKFWTTGSATRCSRDDHVAPTAYGRETSGLTTSSRWSQLPMRPQRPSSGSADTPVMLSFPSRY